MDFSWTEERLDFQHRVFEFAQSELNGEVLARDQSASFSRENWQKCAKFGIQGLCIPEEYGGSGHDVMTAVLAMEAIGRGCRDNGFTLALSVQLWIVQQSILAFGTEEQKQRYLPPLCNGEIIGAYGITEPDSGSDVYSMQMTADPHEEGIILSGRKAFVTFAPLADLVLVFAREIPEAGMFGISSFIVEQGTPGFEVSADLDKMGLRTLPFADLHFTDCVVPHDSRLGARGAGAAISNNSLEWERSCMLAGFLGAMRRQLDVTIKFAKTRQQFGQPIGKFQSVANRIADMKLRLETASLLIYKVAWLKKSARPAALEAALAKLHLTECYLESSLDAIRTHGGVGYLTETGVERDLRDAIGGLLYGGTSDIQRQIVARLLGL